MIRALRSAIRRWAGADTQHPFISGLIGVFRWSRLLYVKLEEDKAFVRAAGLAYGTLIALVPLLLLVFGLVHVMGLVQTDPTTGKLAANAVENLLFGTVLSDLPEVRAVLVPGLRAVDLPALGLVGVGSLVVVAGRLYIMTEEAYNDIFGVAVDRGWGSRIGAFLGALLVVPALVVAGTVGAQGIGWEHPLQSRWALGVLQGVALLVALKLLPCTRVRWIPALVGATVSGLMLEGVTRLFPLYIRWFASDDALQRMYGALALLPLFLLWLYFLWVCVLIGVAIAYVLQNTRSLLAAEREQADREGAILRVPSPELAVELALRIAAARAPIAVDLLAVQAGLSARDVHAIARVLEAAGLLVHEADLFALARPAEQIRLVEVQDAFREQTALRSQPVPLGDELGEALRVRLTGTLAEGLRRFHVEEHGEEVGDILG